MWFRRLLVRILWRGIRWRKACALWLLNPKPKYIKPLGAKKAGLRASFHVVDEWAAVAAQRNCDILEAAAVKKPQGGAYGENL